ncbi:selenoprotein W-related protein [Natronorubrum sediminis]|uniref:Selenoprotein W-related protein n=1 Tax=Natronorubrum sediminis TaxID=640943 RepID=A0A1H6FPS7_9EURY|nr:Rdx family protein [Natronorubrum sediminis]SEH12128.1 selenoprotein W-related protein [Natronorubrum sediminis]
MTSVEIEYCVSCGFLERAEALQHALLSTFGEQLESVTLRTGANGILAVRVDDELVYEKSESAYDVDEIVRRVRDRL